MARSKPSAFKPAIMFFCVFSVCVLLHGCLGLRFTTQPKDNTFAIGEVATLSCGVNSLRETTNHHWIKGDPTTQQYVSIGTSIYAQDFDATRYAVFRNGGLFTLRISKLKPEEEGTYFCSLYDNGVWINSEVAALHVISKWPRPSCSTHPDRGSVGSPATFTCTLPSSAEFELPLTWAYRKQDFGGRKVVRPGESYSVEWVLQERDNYGYFTCYAGRTTGHGDPCVDTPLKIPPKPTVKPLERKKIEGENAEFDCTTAIQHPNVTRYMWFVQGHLGYHEYTRTTGRFRVRDDGKNFKIRNLTLHDNEMKVWCKAQNLLGVSAEAVEKAVVYVTEPILTTDGGKVDPVQKENPDQDGNVVTPLVPSTATIVNKSDIMYGPDSRSDSTNVIIAGTISGIVLLIIIVILTLYLVKDKGIGKLMPGQSKNVIPVSVEKKKDNTNRYSKIVLRPFSVMERRPSTSAIQAEDGHVLYSLPLQKGGGTFKVKTGNNEPPETLQTAQIPGGFKKTRNATLPVGLRGPTESKSSSRSTSASSIDSKHEGEYVVYSLSQKCGGGTMKVKSVESLDRLQQSNVAEVKPTRRDDPAYDVAYDHNKRKNNEGRLSRYSNVRNVQASDGYREFKQSLQDLTKRESDYANFSEVDDHTYADVSINPDDSQYENMTGTIKKAHAPGLQYAQSPVDDYSYDSSFDDDLEDPRTMNVEGIVYAHLDVDNTAIGGKNKEIIGREGRTVYAHIKEVH